MVIERFPVDLKIGRPDFLDSGWREIIRECQELDCLTLSNKFGSAAKQAIETGQASKGKALWLLADACSLRLKGEPPTNPFGPMFVTPGYRSPIAEDFTEEDLAFFAEIAEEIDHPFLQSRIADLVWVRDRKRGIRYALMALEAYSSIPLVKETWPGLCRACWSRALSLAKLVRKAAKERFQIMEAAILHAFEGATREDGYFALEMARLMSKHGLGSGKAQGIGSKLEALAEDAEARVDSFAARDYLFEAGRWFQDSGNKRKWAEIMARIAETYVHSAQERLVNDPRSHMVAASFYEDAIQAYRTVPKSLRGKHRVKERMEELRILMNDSGEQSLEEMGSVPVGSYDLTRSVEASWAAVGGKEVVEALFSLANHPAHIKVDHLREAAERMLESGGLMSMLGSTHVSSDGRVIAKSPGLRPDGSDAEEREQAVHAQMVRHYGLLTKLIVEGEILPCLEVVVQEHCLGLDDFVLIARHSPVVPPGREHLFGMGLLAGINGEFGTAIHLIAPQIENMVRFHLKNAGVTTTTLDSEGIEMEVGLSKLMEFPDNEIIWGKDMFFELKSMFCDPIGPNLRNELAHGLVDDSVCHSVPAAYGWWLGLKLAYLPFWNRARKANPGV